MLLTTFFVLNLVYLLNCWKNRIVMFCKYEFIHQTYYSSFSGVIPQLTGRSLRYALCVGYLTTCFSSFVILWSPSEIRLTSKLQIFSPWEQQAAEFWISHQSFLLCFCLIFPLTFLFTGYEPLESCSDQPHRSVSYLRISTGGKYLWPSWCLRWCGVDSLKKCSLRTIDMAVLEQAAIFFISPLSWVT